MPLLQPLTRPKSPNSSLLSAKSYDPDASSIRSDQESDSEDDERQARARNSRELRAHDRIVLLEEEEMDQLVIEARRRQERQRERSGSGQRRGSNLSLPLPMRLFSKTKSDKSRSTSPADRVVMEEGSTEDLRGEARRQRRQRRRQKKERLLEKAQDGEDGELMHEMEEGHMKETSSTGSSDREDSDELDRQGLLHLADAKSQRKRHRRRWKSVYALIAVAFAVLSIAAWRLSLKRRPVVKQQPLVSNGTALFAPTTIIISLDGFRADFLLRNLTPRLNTFVQEGVSPLYMSPSFPSVTFPNHFTLATGLYPEAHGVVGNSFWDPDLKEEFFYTNTKVSMQSKWWNGEPFWVTAEKQGVRSAIHMWPGSEAHLGEIEPAYVDKYNGKEKLSNKANRILELLDRPGMENPNVDTADMRPQLIAAYVPNVDADGHRFGPNSTEIRSTIQEADKMMDGIFLGLEARNLTNIVNVIVVSDHGMATTDVSRMIQMDDLVDLGKIDHIDGWPLVGLRPKSSADVEEMYDALAGKAKTNPNFDVYLRDVNMPERYHFSQNERIAPLWIVPKAGWAIVTKDEFDIEEAKAKNLEYSPKGLHGYDHEHPLMRAIFIARGPAFPHTPGSKLEAFQNIEVYNIVCDSLGLEPAANNGTLRLPLKPVGVHDQVPAIEVPSEPVTSYTLEPTTNPTPSVSRPTSPKVVGVDPVETGEVSAPVGVDVPEGPSDDENKEEAGSIGDSAKNFWGWATDEFGKAWKWTTGKAGEAWEKITGADKSESNNGVGEAPRI
jgi:predicted AlkP superfamily pyrophosphatase or phosphodiesterase